MQWYDLSMLPNQDRKTAEDTQTFSMFPTQSRKFRNQTSKWNQLLPNSWSEGIVQRSRTLSQSLGRFSVDRRCQEFIPVAVWVHNFHEFSISKIQRPLPVGLTAVKERLELIASKDFARMSYTEAVEVSLLSDLHFLILSLGMGTRSWAATLAFWLGGGAKF